MKKICPICSNPYEGRSSYCSRSCKNKRYYLANLKEKSCPVCGVKFIGTNFKTFCSTECVKRSVVKTKKSCALCNKPFEGIHGQLYCSKTCYRLANKNLKLKEYSCIICGFKFKARDTITNPICCEKCSSKLVVHFSNILVFKIRSGEYDEKI